MNGANIASKLDGKISVGGITRVTFDLMGEVKRLVGGWTVLKQSFSEVI